MGLTAEDLGLRWARVHPQPGPLRECVCVCVGGAHTRALCLGVFLLCSPNGGSQGTAISFSRRQACLPAKRQVLRVPAGAQASCTHAHVHLHEHTISLCEPKCSSASWHRSEGAPSRRAGPSP